MALILGIETATHTCSISLFENGAILASRLSSDSRSHASNITLFIDQVMKESGKEMSELDAVAISAGPGSYTGLRIGSSTAKGLCYALDIPLIAVSTLEAMADGYRTEKPGLASLLCPMIDARRMEVFCGVYDQNLVHVMEEGPRVIDANSFGELGSDREIIFFGTGAAKCAELLDKPHYHFDKGFENKAEHLMGIAERRFKDREFTDLAYFEPSYLKGFIPHK